MPNRRDFILQTCSFCATAAGLGFIASQLESCKTPEGSKASTTDDKKVTVTKSLITVPLIVFGEQKNYLVKDFSLDYDILVVKHPDESYSALQMRCSHRSYRLRVTPTNIVCDNHGSEFDFDGNVTHDPAKSPLQKYPCSVEDNKVMVKLVG